MPISSQNVKKIAKLAALALNSEEIGSLSKDLSNILELVAQMDSADTEGVLPNSHPFDINQRLREDKVTDSDQRDLFLSNAPESKNGLFLVPKVID
tara:strand:- start:1359 stop:1646 length:288 start_codon:yes stop_codon:yes gene_type:complete